MSKPRLAILGSGQGSNFVALHEAILAGQLDAEIVLVASDKPDALILSRAATFGLPTATLLPSPFKTKLSPEGELALVELLKRHHAEWVILAGYMRVVKEPLLRAFPNRIINIHPSLLPAFKGTRVHERVIAAGAAHSGASVHFVVPELDAGPVIAQASVPVHPSDTPEILADRVLTVEHKLYPEALNLLASDKVRLENGLAVFS
jgi:phosphoribosylglycinamide formyltransferase 1